MSSIRNASQLHAGDHISMPTDMLPGLLDHHAIVTAPLGGNVFKVIHATTGGGSYASSGSGSSNYRVAEEKIDLGQYMGNGTLIRYDYAPGECYEPFEVIQRARSKIGRFDFSVMSNNCEHFARDCKTGNKTSDQARGALNAAVASAAAVSWSLFKSM